MTGAVCQAEPTDAVSSVVDGAEMSSVTSKLRARRVARTVVRRDGLGAEQVVEVVRGLVRGGRVLDAAREDDLLDARDRRRTSRPGRRSVPVSFVFTKISVPATWAYGLDSTSESAGARRAAEIHLDDGSRMCRSPRCRRGRRRGSGTGRRGRERPVSGLVTVLQPPAKRVAGTVGEARRCAARGRARGGSDAGERVRAVRRP